MNFEQARAAIDAGTLKAHALWLLLSAESDRDGYGLKPGIWEGPGEYQRVSYVGSDGIGFLVRLPTVTHLKVA